MNYGGINYIGRRARSEVWHIILSLNILGLVSTTLSMIIFTTILNTDICLAFQYWKKFHYTEEKQCSPLKETIIILSNCKYIEWYNNNLHNTLTQSMYVRVRRFCQHKAFFVASRNCKHWYFIGFVSGRYNSRLSSNFHWHTKFWFFFFFITLICIWKVEIEWGFASYHSHCDWALCPNQIIR